MIYALDHGEKVHPWRFCQKGKHFVKEHSENIPPSKAHPEGMTVIVHEHCASNPSHKDELSAYEAKYISQTYFQNLVGPPASNVLIEYENADKFDSEIRGWVQYWNDIFKSNEPLDPNLIKALIATESGFDPNPKKNKVAHGLMQLMPLTVRVLGDTKGEIKDSLVILTLNEALDPSLNICAGVRWLFRKRETASHRLGRQATWEEAVIEYKDYWTEVNSGRDPIGMQHLREFLKRLSKK